MIYGKSVFSKTFNRELAKEDERYDYEGKFDDTAPGIRYNYLGTLDEYLRYRELIDR